MIENKHIGKIIVALIGLVVVLCVAAMLFSQQLSDIAGGTAVAMEYETELFDVNEVIEINILIDEEDYQDMLANPLSKSYYACDVEINGDTFYDVAIRTKGNTSLSAVANDPDSQRYSFKLEFDHYVDGQSCYGLDKLVLNNNYADATSMKEALIYDMFQYLGADASLYNYAEISINGQYWGVYLALGAVEDSFLLRNYGVVNGELYKPDDMNMAGGGDFGGGMEWPGELAEDFQTMTFDGETANAFGPDMASEDMASQDMPNIEETERPQGGRPAGGGFGGAEGTDSASATPPDTDSASTTPPDSGAGDTVAFGDGSENRFPGNMDNNMDINRQSMADWQNWCVYGGCLFLLLAALWMANKFVRRPYRQRRKNKTRDKG